MSISEQIEGLVEGLGGTRQSLAGPSPTASSPPVWPARDPVSSAQWHQIPDCPEAGRVPIDGLSLSFGILGINTRVLCGSSPKLAAMNNQPLTSTVANIAVLKEGKGILERLVTHFAAFAFW